MKNFAFLLLFVFGLFSSQKYSKDEISRITQGDVQTALPIFNVSDENQHQVLLAQSQDAKPKDKYTKILVERMKLALLSTDGGVGIAAPQVGINRNIIWVQRFDKTGNPLEYFINPKIIWKSALQNLGGEGDLSIDDFRNQFYRSKVIQLEYYDLDGKKHTEMVEGFTAVIFQHEIDHLSGILISDKFEKEKGNSYKKVEAYLPENYPFR